MLVSAPLGPCVDWGVVLLYRSTGGHLKPGFCTVLERRGHVWLPLLFFMGHSVKTPRTRTSMRAPAFGLPHQPRTLQHTPVPRAPKAVLWWIGALALPA